MIVSTVNDSDAIFKVLGDIKPPVLITPVQWSTDTTVCLELALVSV